MSGNEDKIKEIKNNMSEFDLRNLMLANFTSKEERRFHHYIKGICQRLLGDTIDLDQKNIIFSLSDKKEINAAHVAKGTVNVIYITEGLFDLCQNEDQLAFVLGHELGHYEERLRQGAGKQNSKTEETACDLRAIQKMARGGYNLEEACNIAAELFDKRHINIKDLEDPHTNNTSRINLINAMKKREKDRVIEEQNIEITQSTPIPEAIKDMVHGRSKRPPFSDILFNQINQVHDKYGNDDNISTEEYYFLICKEVTAEWLKLFHEHVIPDGSFYAMTEEDISAFAQCIDNYLYGDYDHFEDKFLAAVFADMEAMRNTDKYAAYIEAMRSILRKIEVEDDDLHTRIDAEENDSKTAAWLRHYLHGFREAEGQQFDDILNNLDYVKKFIAVPYYNDYRGIFVKNFNILELEFNENDIGKKISPRALNYIKANIDAKNRFLTFSGLKAHKIGDSLLLTHEDKDWSFYVDSSGKITHSFSAQDLAQTQILLAKNSIESIQTNIEAVADGKITDVRERLSVLREAHKIISAVSPINDLSNVVDFGNQDKDITFTDVKAILSRQAEKIFNERFAKTSDNLVYTNKITNLYADTIRTAPKEYFAEILDALVQSDIAHRLSGEDKLMRAFLDNPNFNEKLSQTIKSFEPFPKDSVGWDEKNMSEYDDADTRRRLLKMISKIKEITDLKLAEELEHGGDFDHFYQPFKKDLAKLFGFEPEGNIDDDTMLENLKITRNRNYKPITLYEKAYIAYTSYDALKSNDHRSVELLLGYNGAGVDIKVKCNNMNQYIKSPEKYNISGDNQEQIQQRQQELLTVTDKIHDRLVQRIDKETEKGNISANDVYYMIHANINHNNGVYGRYGFNTLITNKDFEKSILHNIETGNDLEIHSSLLSLCNIAHEYKNTKDSDVYKEKVWPSVAKVFERNKDDLNIEEKTDAFRAMTNFGIFASDYKRYYEILIGKDGKSGLLKEIENETQMNPKQKFGCYVKLLNKWARIPDPEIRADVIKKAAYNFWLDHSSYNDIDAHEIQRTFMIDNIKRIKESNIAELDKIEILKELSELTMSQKELSLAMKPDTIDLQTSDSRAIKAAYGLDTIAYALQQYPEVKVQFQDFLLGEGKSEEATALVKDIQIAACKEHDQYGTPKVLERYLNGENIINELDYQEQDCFNQITPQACLHFKKEFDAAPLEAKALIVNEIITNGTSDWEESFKTVSDKLFADAGELGKVGSDFLHSYIAARPNSEKTFYLAAMMAAANNKSKSSENYKNSPYSPEERNLAKGLRLFLENSGPAGTKLAQAMASYAEVPEFIRYEMQYAKSEANPPARWEIFSGNDDTMDKLLKHGALGKRRGSASFFVTYDLGDKIVKIMRRGAQLKADSEFAIYSEMLQTLSSEYKNISSFKRLIQNAAENVHIETDLKIGKQQYLDAKKMYPETVTANNITFNIKVMDWVNHDKDWAIMDKAQGVDFKQLKEPYKTAAAKAVFATELSNMLSGKRFDSDRHGGQYKFDTQNNVIGVFDTGSMSMIEPTDKERNALGLVLAQTLKGLRYNQNVAAVFSAEIDKVANEMYKDEISQNKSIPPYLSEFQRGMLALNDFYAQLSNKDLAECMIKAMDNGKNQIHPQIIKAFKLEIKKSLDSHNVSIDELLNPEKTDDLLPEARANRRIGKILFDTVFESLSENKRIDISSNSAQKLVSRLNNSDADLQIVKGVVRGAYAKLNPNNYTQKDKEELGMFLYNICQADLKNQKLKKEEALENIIAEVATKYPRMGTYTQNVMKLVSLMAKIPALSHDKLKKAAAFVAFTDNNVARGFKKALNDDKRIGFAKRMMLNLVPMGFIPPNAQKMLIKAVSKRFVTDYVSKKLFGTTAKTQLKSDSIEI